MSGSSRGPLCTATHHAAAVVPPVLTDTLSSDWCLPGKNAAAVACLEDPGCSRIRMLQDLAHCL